MEFRLTEQSGTALQAAIDMVSSGGGGKVIVPAGILTTGTIRLKDYVELHLEAGAILKASGDLDDYNDLDEYPENQGCKNEEWNHKHLIIANRVKGVSITGPGTIDGSAELFFDDGHLFCSNAFIWRYGLRLAKDKEKLRPGPLICFIKCKDVRITELSIQNSTCWNLFYHGCDDVFICGVKISNHKANANTDGIDIDCCKNIIVSDSLIDTGDDAIAIRGNSQRLDENKPCENIHINNCILSSASSAVRIGVGDGIIRNVSISNITILEAFTGIHLQPQFGDPRPGGVAISKIRVNNISMDNVEMPFTLCSGPKEATTASIDNVVFSNWDATFFGLGWIQGEGSSVPQNIILKDMLLTCIPQPVDPLIHIIEPSEVVHIENADVQCKDITIKFRNVNSRSTYSLLSKQE